MPRILIVDDDPRFCRAVQIALGSRDFEVLDAADGQTALDSIAADVPDLVVLDWNMPGMNGIQTCRALRERSQVPVIMVSADRSNSREAALQAGANDYLRKPFSCKDLLTHILSALNA